MDPGAGQNGRSKRGLGRVCERRTPEEAETYYHQVMQDPVALADYEEVAAERGCPVREIILQDALTPPVIERVDLSGYAGRAGDIIRVWATDDFMLMGVSVEIQDGHNNSVETGVADIPEFEGGPWCYRATSTITDNQLVEISVLVVDVAVNMTTKMELFRRVSS